MVTTLDTSWETSADDSGMAAELSGVKQSLEPMMKVINIDILSLLPDEAVAIVPASWFLGKAVPWGSDEICGHWLFTLEIYRIG